MPHDVVISYSRRNREIADRFAGLLRERGLDVWYDRMIRTGADWRDEIARAIGGSRCFVILFSAESNDSEELKKEYSIADRRDLHIVPIRVENVEPAGFFEYELSRRQWFDAFDNRDAQLIVAADQLVEVLRPLAQARSEPAPAKPVEPERPAPPRRVLKQAAPRSRAHWAYLVFAGLNFLLGVVPTYLLLWPLTQAIFTHLSAQGRTLPMPAKLFSYAILGAGVVVLLFWLLGVLTDDVVLTLGAVFAAGGLALAAYLALQVFGRDKRVVAFWIAPAVGAAVTGLVFVLAMLGDDDYFLFAGLGMTIANAAFLFDAWQRWTLAKP